MGGVAAHEFDELGVEGFLQCGVLLAGLVLEVGEALRDGVHLLLDFGAERRGGGGVVVAEALEILLEGLAEGGDVADDLVAQGGSGGGTVLAGAVGFGGIFGAEMSEFAAKVMVEGFGTGVEAGKLVGDLGEAGVLRGG